MISGPANLVLQTLKTSPTAHDEGIIRSDHRDDIHPLFLKVVVLLKIWGQMVRVASGLRGCCIYPGQVEPENTRLP